MKGTAVVEALGADWYVEYDYYGGTNYTIHSASLEPNEPLDLEIDYIDSVDNQIPDEIFNLIRKKLHDILLGLLVTKLKNPEEEY